MTRYVEDIKLTFLSGHPFHGEISESDFERIAAEIVEAYEEPPDYEQCPTES